MSIITKNRRTYLLSINTNKIYIHFLNRIVLGDLTLSDNKHNSSNLEKDIVKDFPIPKRWRRIIVDLAKQQVGSMEEPEEWSDILEDWGWFSNPHPWIFKTLETLVRSPASSAFQLANNYVFDENIENENTTRREIENYAARFRRALYKLHSVGLVSSIVLGPDVVGNKRNTVTIWIAPFAKEKQIERTIEFYKNIGGVKGPLPKQDKKTPKEVTEHNRKMKALAVFDKYKIHPQLFDHYKCSKNHAEGLKRHRKIKHMYMRKRIQRACPSCNRDLVLISHNDFLSLKKKRLEGEYSVKL